VLPAGVVVLLNEDEKKLITVCKTEQLNKAVLHRASAKRERKYRSYSFSTSALVGEEWLASLPGRALPPRKIFMIPTGYEAGCVSELVWRQRLEEKSFASPAI
jgi:hypothetical protein